MLCGQIFWFNNNLCKNVNLLWEIIYLNYNAETLTYLVQGPKEHFVISIVRILSTIHFFYLLYRKRNFFCLWLYYNVDKQFSAVCFNPLNLLIQFDVFF